MRSFAGDIAAGASIIDGNGGFLFGQRTVVSSFPRDGRYDGRGSARGNQR